MSVLAAALDYARLGWPVLPVPAGSKAATLTGHGVKDATTDPDVIRSWWARWPDANVAIACGLPGPHVLDIDDLDRARALLARFRDRGVAEVATGRGEQFYFAGQASGTVGLGYGELRGRDSYVVAPPSVHPSGKLYVWLVPPRGPLPPVPAGLTRGLSTAGAGVMPERSQVEPGGMYDAQKDLAARQAQARVLDVRLVERFLLVAFELWRVPGADYGDPRQGRRDTRRLAEWAVKSDIAERERWRADYERRLAERRVLSDTRERGAS